MAATVRRFGVWIAVAAALLIVPQIFSSILAISILNQMGIMIVFALSYNMLLGQGGMLSFGHAVYFGLGGFLAVHVMNFVEYDGLFLPLPLVPLVGGLFGLLFGALFGSFSTRRAGTVFAMISLGIGEMIAACSIIFVAFFGGEEGISGDRTMGSGFLGTDFARDVDIYYLIAFWVFISAALMYLFSRTPAGRMANAVRDNDERAEFVGYSQRAVRFISFCASGFFAGIAGGLFAVNYEILTEENLNLVTSGTVLLMAYIGGVGFFIGPVVGAILFTLLQTVLSNYTEIWQLYVGALFVATVMYMPTGLTGILMMHEAAFRMRRLHHLARPYLKTGIPVIACLIGVIGGLEMLHHANAAPAGETMMSLFFVSVDTASPLSWIVVSAFTLAGGYLAKRSAAGLRDSWERINSPDAMGEAP